MFGLGMGEILVLGVLGLILIGPEQLPELARTIGRFINDLKRSTEGLTDDIKKQAKVDIDLDFMKPNKFKPNPTKANPLSDNQVGNDNFSHDSGNDHYSHDQLSPEEYKKLIQQPIEITEPHHGKKMTHNEFGELIIDPPEPNQLALFEEDPADKKNSNS